MLKFLLMIGVTLIMSFGMFASSFANAQEETEELKAARLANEAKEKVYLRLEIPDTFDTIMLLGKTIEELNIPHQAIKYVGNSPFSVIYNTMLMDKSVEGYLYFKTDFENKKNVSSNFYVTDDAVYFMKCKEYLDNKLGEHHTSDITPYAAVNGGSVQYFIYYKDGYKYNLSHGNAHNHYTLEISRGIPKGKPSRKLDYFLNLNNSNTINMEAPKMMESTVVNYNEINKWTCASCGNKAATGKFCGNCGTPKPVPKAVEPWDCDKCGAKNNNRKFCIACGNPCPQFRK